MPPLPDWQVVSCILELWADYCFTSSFWPDWTLHSHYWYGLFYLEKALYKFCLLSIYLILTKTARILYCYHSFWFIFTCMTFINRRESPEYIQYWRLSAWGSKAYYANRYIFFTPLCLHSSINLLTHLISFKNQSIGLLVFFLRIAFSCYQLPCPCSFKNFTITEYSHSLTVQVWWSFHLVPVIHIPF